MVTASGTDELVQAGVAAFEATVHDAGRLEPHECRPAVTGPPGKRECHAVFGPAAQPWVTATVRARRGDGDRTDSGSGTGHDVSVARTAHQLTARR
jgi:hypothetical protein